MNIGSSRNTLVHLAEEDPLNEEVCCSLNKTIFKKPSF